MDEKSAPSWRHVYQSIPYQLVGRRAFPPILSENQTIPRLFETPKFIIRWAR
jgi:hypothetical protein